MPIRVEAHGTTDENFRTRGWGPHTGALHSQGNVGCTIGIWPRGARVPHSPSTARPSIFQRVGIMWMAKGWPTHEPDQDCRVGLKALVGKCSREDHQSAACSTVPAGAAFKVEAIPRCVPEGRLCLGCHAHVARPTLYARKCQQGNLFQDRSSHTAIPKEGLRHASCP